MMISEENSKYLAKMEITKSTLDEHIKSVMKSPDQSRPSTTPTPDSPPWVHLRDYEDRLMERPQKVSKKCHTTSFCVFNFRFLCVMGYNI